MTLSFYNIALATIFAVITINVISLTMAFAVTINADIRWNRYAIFNGVYGESTVFIILIGGMMVCMKMMLASCLYFCIYGVTHHLINFISCPVLMYFAYGQMEYSLSILLTYVHWPKSRNGSFMNGIGEPLNNVTFACLVCTMFAIIVINIATIVLH